MFCARVCTTADVQDLGIEVCSYSVFVNSHGGSFEWRNSQLNTRTILEEAEHTGSHKKGLRALRDTTASLTYPEQTIVHNVTDVLRNDWGVKVGRGRLALIGLELRKNRRLRLLDGLKSFTPFRGKPPSRVGMILTFAAFNVSSYPGKSPAFTSLR